MKTKDINELKQELSNRLGILINSPVVPETQETIKYMVEDIIFARGFKPYPDDIRVERQGDCFNITTTWWNIDVTGYYIEFKIGRS